MRRGARSLRGALGTYTWAASAAVAALALVLWTGPCAEPARTRVVLDADERWIGATLDDGERIWEMSRRTDLFLLPGRYRLTLFDAAGDAVVHSIRVEGRLLRVGEGGVVTAPEPNAR